MEAIRQIKDAPLPVGPYNPAIKANGFIFCAGQIPLDPHTGQLVEGGILEQTEQVLKNLQAVLRQAGASFDKVVMTTIFLAEISDAKIVNEVYAKFVDELSPPARQTVAVKALPLGALVEISVIAAS